ncbi:hypothetical protein [Sinorhizobium medicae]|uniref:hypothetical protein n=1 Tax=Sinorhizobium medicae TaxID=110321 RepID=UPI000FDBDB15|nr:hypothetical protein [Sinorhizobium medicae]MDX0439138.1 hypothetical protein [Sinorhizobium medicae]MDX0617557.1 hypothetical protein [Sinorhizobium medicae]MDX0654716.1 hypothetical protein [Sinorhizobium medicae]MDX1090924.1 hypothetical protein [Sinorhizobium medicae]MDX1115549.1 hypothetical protein [Sinorhizobium medicae]
MIDAIFKALGVLPADVAALSAVIAACALAVGVTTFLVNSVIAWVNYQASKEIRDYNAVVSNLALSREQMKALLKEAAAVPRNEQNYKIAVIDWINALDVIAFGLNEKLFNGAVADYEAKWLRAELHGLYHDSPNKKRVMLESMEKNPDGYEQIVKFYGSAPKPDSASSSVLPHADSTVISLNSAASTNT